MKKDSFASLLLLVVALSLAIGCESCKDKEPQKVYITNAAYARAATFKEGSFMVYRDAVSGDVDSFILYRHERFFPPGLDNPKVIFEYVSSYFQEYGNQISNFSFDYSAGSPQKILTYYSMELPVCLFYDGDMSVGDVTTIRNEVTHIKLGELNPYSIAGNTYYNVSVIKSEQDSISCTTFFSLEDGLVEYQLSDGVDTADWQLINHHFIR